jgi:hypothetical protein
LFFLVEICRIVDVLDMSQNRGKPMEEYTFWPDVHEGLRTMYLRTHFAIGEGGFFPAVKVRKVIVKYFVQMTAECAFDTAL